MAMIVLEATIWLNNGCWFARVGPDVGIGISNVVSILVVVVMNMLACRFVFPEMEIWPNGYGSFFDANVLIHDIPELKWKAFVHRGTDFETFCFCARNERMQGFFALSISSSCLSCWFANFLLRFIISNLLSATHECT
jgi:hypothetical protein